MHPDEDNLNRFTFYDGINISSTRKYSVVMDPVRYPPCLIDGHRTNGIYRVVCEMDPSRCPNGADPLARQSPQNLLVNVLNVFRAFRADPPTPLCVVCGPGGNALVSTSDITRCVGFCSGTRSPSKLHATKGLMCHNSN